MSESLQRPPPDGARWYNMRALRRHRRGSVLVVIARQPDSRAFGQYAARRAYGWCLDGSRPTFARLS